MQRFTIPVEAHLVLRRGGDLLMLLRRGTGYMDGHWGLVAGHVDGGETFRQAMAREAAEEAGLMLDPVSLTLAHMMHRREGGERMSLFFTCTDWSGTPRNREPEKCAALEWHDADRLPVPTIPYIAAGLSYVAAGTAYSEFGWDTAAESA